MTASDDFSPRRVGDLGNPLTITFTDHLIDPSTGTTTPYDLTGLAPSAFTLLIKNASTKVEGVGMGAWTVVDARAGIAQYAWNAADVATVGSFSIRAQVHFTGGIVTFEPRILQIVP